MSASTSIVVAMCLCVSASCGSGPDRAASAKSPASDIIRAASPGYSGGEASLSRAADQGMLTIAAGAYVAGSPPEEREQAYDDYRATAGHDSARRNNWFARERERTRTELGEFRIDQTLVTNAAYAEYVRDTGVRSPTIDAETWNKQKFNQDYETQVKRYNWDEDTPPPGREDHPVVLVTWDDAAGYCAWRGEVVGEPRRLPTADEYEKAARGAEGLIYPWGNRFDPEKLNSAVAGEEDTTAVGQFPDGASPYGMLDAAGNVFQWTATPWPHKKQGMTVKGSAWDDFAGVGRGASLHGRRKWVRHAIVGFRCASERTP